MVATEMDLALGAGRADAKSRHQGDVSGEGRALCPPESLLFLASSPPLCLLGLLPASWSFSLPFPI